MFIRMSRQINWGNHCKGGLIGRHTCRSWSPISHFIKRSYREWSLSRERLAATWAEDTPKSWEWRIYIPLQFVRYAGVRTGTAIRAVLITASGSPGSSAGALCKVSSRSYTLHLQGKASGLGRIASVVNSDISFDRIESFLSNHSKEPAQRIGSF